MSVHDDSRALDEYRRAAALDRADRDALAGAGRAAFQLAQYAVSHQYLHQAIARGSSDPAVANLVEIVDAMFALDPYAPRISNLERRSRVIRAFQQAGERLAQCAVAPKQSVPWQARATNSATAGQAAANNAPPGTGAPTLTEAEKRYAEWQKLRARMTERTLRHDPDLMDKAMDLSFRIEQQSDAQCAPPAAADTALVLIARQRVGS